MSVCGTNGPVTDEESEAQTGEIVSQGHTASPGQSFLTELLPVGLDMRPPPKLHPYPANLQFPRVETLISCNPAIEEIAINLLLVRGGALWQPGPKFVVLGRDWRTPSFSLLMSF